MIDLSQVLLFSASLFVIGLVGVLINRLHLIKLLVSVEIMLLAVMTNLVAFSFFLNDLHGQVLTLLILLVGLGKIILALMLLILLFQHKQTTRIIDLNRLNG